MSSHKFRVGQTVGYAQSHFGTVPSAQSYKIMRLMPAEGREKLYRIKVVAEVFERVARESELSITTTAQ
jgi:hypothetical protein